MGILREIYRAAARDYRRRRDLIRNEGIRPLFINSRGYVLILVLLITSLLISITANFIVETQTSIGYMKKFDSRLRAGFLARSALQLSKYMLDADKKGYTGMTLSGRTTDKNIDCYDDIWATQYPPIPLEDGSVEIIIEDENSRININAFANEFTEKTKYYYMAQTFFINMGLPMDFADIMHDWVDPDDYRFPYGAETGDYYLTLVPPYSAKNGAMDSIDEMLMLKDITPEIYYGMGGGSSGIEENLVDHNKGDITLDLDKLEQLTGSDKTKASPETPDDKSAVEFRIGKEKSRSLSDYFRVYGDRKDFLNNYNKININTASYRIISALTENMTDDKVSELIRRRLITPYRDVEDIKDIIDDDDEFETLKKYISVKSYIFKIRTIATINSTKVTITAFYNRDSKKFLYWCEE